MEGKLFMQHFLHTEAGILFQGSMVCACPLLLLAQGDIWSRVLNIFSHLNPKLLLVLENL
jgi:hypothetical protein